MNIRTANTIDIDKILLLEEQIFHFHLNARPDWVDEKKRLFDYGFMKNTVKRLWIIAIAAAIVFSTCSDGNDPSDTVPIGMVRISAGTFMMGSPDTEPNRYNDETQHLVTLSGFFMGKYQVTQDQYQAVMKNKPSFFSADPQADEIQNKRPVKMVSWYDALVFCNKLSVMEGLSPAYSINGKTNPEDWGTVPTSNDATWNEVIIVAGSTGYRLPTEAQWEYACRAGTTTAYNTGDTINDNTGWYSSNSGSKTHDVGLKLANAWGLYDMHGNVWEWCWDWYGSYPSKVQTNPEGASSGVRRVKRGGSWRDSAQGLRSAVRFIYYPNIRMYNLGFRLVRPWSDGEGNGRKADSSTQQYRPKKPDGE